LASLREPHGAAALLNKKTLPIPTYVLSSDKPIVQAPEMADGGHHGCYGSSVWAGLDFLAICDRETGDEP
jgi:hypothetical protein